MKQDCCIPVQAKVLILYTSNYMIGSLISINLNQKSPIKILFMIGD